MRIDIKNDEINFNTIIEEISSDKILLPDFQRNFVWTKKEQQTCLAASALCRMPLGSILLLNSKEDIFCAKKIGRKEYVNIKKIDDEISYLLDGQQRITLLTNIFSDVIRSQQDSLKRRFYLKIPRLGHELYDKDLFGFNTLHFRLGSDERISYDDKPDFTTEEIQNLICCYTYRKDDKNANNPDYEASNDELQDFCVKKDGYLIPLYLLAKDSNHKKKNSDRLYSLWKRIMSSHIGDLYEQCMKKESEEEKIEFLLPVLENVDDCKKAIVSIETLEEFEDNLAGAAERWRDDFRKYLDCCIDQMSLHIMGVPNSDRAKAIEIFENMNRGGVQLSTFDLVVARVSKVNREFVENMIQTLCAKPEEAYFTGCVEHSVEQAYDERKKQLEQKEKYFCATLEIEGIKKREIENIYKETFLNVLSLYSNNPDFCSEKIKKEYFSRKAILDLSAEQINNNYKKVCKAMDRAAFFLMASCGIRKISEVNYKLMFTIISYLFIKEEWYKDKKIHGYIRGWYWSSIFSGHYDRNQNSVAERDMQDFIDTFDEKQDVGWIRNLNEKVFDAEQFSNKTFLLYQEKDSRNTPKDVLGNYICQFYLSNSYCEMFSTSKKLTVFAENAKNYEKHHVVPLATDKTQKASDLRNKKCIYNSPLNYVYLTPRDNEKILGNEYYIYSNNINKAVYSALNFEAVEGSKKDGSEETITAILDARFEKLHDNVQKEVENYLG